MALSKTYPVSIASFLKNVNSVSSPTSLANTPSLEAGIESCFVRTIPQKSMSVRPLDSLALEPLILIAISDSVELQAHYQRAQGVREMRTLVALKGLLLLGQMYC